MSSFMKTSDLIESIKRRGMFPQNDKTFQTADFLAFLNDELQIGLVPSIMTVHQEYFVTSEKTPFVPNRSNYSIPYRAIGGKLRDLFYLDTQGTLFEMTRVSPDDRAFFQTSNLQNRFIAFYLQGSEVVLAPPVGPTPSGKLQFTFYLRPNQLVEEKRAAIISAITVDDMAGTTTFTVDKIPTGMSSSILTDIMQMNAGHKTIKYDIQPVSVIGTNITFNNTDLIDQVNSSNFQTESVLPVNVVVGDYISFAGECIVPQVPDELHSVLVQRVVARCLESLGDINGLQAANVKLQEMEMKTGTLVDSRVEGSPIKITNFGGLMRLSRVRRRGWI